MKHIPCPEYVTLIQWKPGGPFTALPKANQMRIKIKCFYCGRSVNRYGTFKKNKKGNTTRNGQKARCYDCKVSRNRIVANAKKRS